MTLELFNTTVSLFDLGVAVLGLLGSSTVAGKSMAAARVRFDTRYELHADLARLWERQRLLMMRVIEAWPAMATPTDAKTVALGLEQAQDALLELRRFDRRMRTQPWLDRAGWHRVRRHLSMDEYQEMITNATAAMRSHAQTGKMPPIDHIFAAGKNILEVEMDEARADLFAFRTYLELRLRPGWVRRLKLWKYRLQILADRPILWPWAV